MIIMTLMAMHTSMLGSILTMNIPLSSLGQFVINVIALVKCGGVMKSTTVCLSVVMVSPPKPMSAFFVRGAR